MLGKRLRSRCLPLAQRKLLEALQRRHAPVQGIRNGVDTSAWSPSGDGLLPKALRYSAADVHAKKAEAKALLQVRGDSGHDRCRSNCWGLRQTCAL